MHLPDPFTPDLKLELLPESQEEPVFDQSYASILNENGFKSKIDAFVENKDTSVFLEVLQNQIKLVTEQREEGGISETYNSDMLCAFVLYIGAKSSQLDDVDTSESPAILAYNHLLSILDSEGKPMIDMLGV
jgi:CCR4-NOT transcription complex subunit 1